MSIAWLKMMGRRHPFWLGLLGGAVLLLAGWSVWLPWVGQWLVVSDPLHTADAIVPLGGGRERIMAGSQLYHDGYATVLVASNAYLNVPGIDVPYSQLVKKEAMWHGVPEAAILEMGPVVHTTYEEVGAILQLAQAEGWSTIIVVTSPFHTRRARWMVQDVFAGTGITVIVVAAEPSWYQGERWWQKADSLRATWSEYVKLLLYLIGYQ